MTDSKTMTESEALRRAKCALITICDSSDPEELRGMLKQIELAAKVPGCDLHAQLCAVTVLIEILEAGY